MSTANGPAAPAADPGLGGARHAAAVTPSDGTVLNCRAVYVGGAGNVAVTLADDSAAVTFTAVAAGTLLPLYCKKVMSTNTTATAIVALF
jgi:hypothetical protein